MPEVGDGDDDQQVKSNSDHRNGREQNIYQHGLSVGAFGYLAGGVQLWKAESSSLQALHHHRGGAAELPG